MNTLLFIMAALIIVITHNPTQIWAFVVVLYLALAAISLVMDIKKWR